MKLLFDQNLSPRLPRFLADLYEGSVHVREVGLRDASDVAVWEYAKQHGFAIVSKDSDFQARSLLYGCPPKFIWLRVGKSSRGAIRRSLLQRFSRVIPLRITSSLKELNSAHSFAAVPPTAKPTSPCVRN